MNKQIKTVSQTEFNRHFKKFEETVKKDPVIVYKNNEPSFVAVPLEFFADAINSNEEDIKVAIERYISLKQGKKTTIKGKEAWEAI